MALSILMTERACGAVPGVLVLVNGNLLHGEVQREGEVYRVRQPHSELVVRVDQVDMFCQSVAEAYEKRRLQRAGQSADTHVELARWCLRHNLLDYASRELLDARALEPSHRNLQTLERQLQLALRNRAARQNPPAPHDAATDEVMTAHAEVNEQVPDWARTLFVRQIQPLLVDSCAASGCHQPSANEPFPINRLAVDGPGHPATTLANLTATLRQLDFASPELSPLLQRAQAPHGIKAGAKPPTFEPHQYHILKTWVEQLAQAQYRPSAREVELTAHEPRIDAWARLAQEAKAAAVDPFDPTEFNVRAPAPESSETPTDHPESE